MRPQVRPLGDRDVEAVVGLSLRAWAPVFASIEQALGAEIYGRLYPDGWQASQRQAVEAVCASQVKRVWVAEVDGTPVGFVAVELHPESSMGEIHMLAVDPDHQGNGIGTALTEFALARIKDAGMAVAMVETGATQGTPQRAARTRRPATSNCR
jgi:ribosomal protein S18 acetylase RimI-like enzyme